MRTADCPNENVRLFDNPFWTYGPLVATVSCCERKITNLIRFLVEINKSNPSSKWPLFTAQKTEITIFFKTRNNTNNEKVFRTKVLYHKSDGPHSSVGSTHCRLWIRSPPKTNIYEHK